MNPRKVPRDNSPAPTVRVATHRRSGTHLMLEYLGTQLGQQPVKWHRFPEARRRQSLPVVYVVRDPVAVMWSTYRWFVRGESANEALAHALQGLSFGDFLRGEAGHRMGFGSWGLSRGESLADARGMFYEPIQFWVDHVRAYIEADDAPCLVRYEDLVEQPAVELARVAGYLQIPMPTELRVIGRDELVGHSPSPSTAPPALDEWDRRSRTLLADTAGELMNSLGYAVPPSIVTPRPGNPLRVRYVSRADNSGYAVAGRRCIEAIASAGIEVVWEPQAKLIGQGRVPPTLGMHEQLVARYRPNAKCGLTVLHTMPERWLELRTSLGHGAFVGHTVWELEQLPQSWLGGIHVADRLWVPTNWNRDTLRRGDVQRPIDVVPHVVTTDSIEPPPIDIPSGVTVFSTVASWHPRKRPDWTVEAFARAFRKGDPVLLIVKTEAWTDSWPAESELERMTWWQLMQVLRRHANPPDVMLVNDEFTDAQVNGLLARSDCYVSLAASEGWGLGLFDAATMGTPVITTGFGGHLSYLGADHPGLVPFSRIDVGAAENSPHFEPGMTWAEPDLDAAAAMMRAIVDGNSDVVAVSEQLAQRLRRDYSPEAVGGHVVSLLEEHR